MIDYMRAIDALDGNRPTLYQAELSSRSGTQRDHYHLLLFLDEFQPRYPGTPSSASDELVRNAVTAANNLQPVITALGIRGAITEAERGLNLPSTAPVPVAAAGPAQDFVNRLTDRCGGYRWSSGTTTDFRNWIAQEPPTPMPLDAQLNCWEALLVAAVEAGLFRRDDVLRAYTAQDTSRSVYELLTTNRTVHRINHTAQAVRGNGIQVGDLVILSVRPVTDPIPVDDPIQLDLTLHHVVAAVTANPNDYRGVEVISLWGASTSQSGAWAQSAGLLTRVSLEELLRVDKTILYFTP
jgi:hypothetical protein